jgi:hypothetical protein
MNWPSLAIAIQVNVAPAPPITADGPMTLGVLWRVPTQGVAERIPEKQRRPGGGQDLGDQKQNGGHRAQNTHE